MEKNIKEIKEILKELKDMNRNLLSIKTFIIAEAQLTKITNQELIKMKREIQKINKKEVKNDKHWWSRFSRSN